MRQELAERTHVPAVAEPLAPGVAQAPLPAAVPAFGRRGWVDAEGLPHAVLATLREQLGDMAIEDAIRKRSDGQ